ncbi:MAG: hypothetical protein ACNA7V_14355, partial [Bacteroidales bacterium]
MKTIKIIFFLMTNASLIHSQDTINHYDTNNVKGYSFQSFNEQYVGEYQIRLKQFYWRNEYNAHNNFISYQFECLSFPFIPDCYLINTEITGSLCISDLETRGFVVLQDELLDSINDPLPGYGWIGASGTKV